MQRCSLGTVAVQRVSKLCATKRKEFATVAAKCDATLSPPELAHISSSCMYTCAPSAHARDICTAVSVAICVNKQTASTARRFGAFPGGDLVEFARQTRQMRMRLRVPHGAALRSCRCTHHCIARPSAVCDRTRRYSRAGQPALTAILTSLGAQRERNAEGVGR